MADEARNSVADTSEERKASAGSLEGRVFQPASAAELAEAIDWAFDYRGDVTLGLNTGEQLVCFLFNRDRGHAEPSVEVYVDGSPAPRVIPYRLIASVTFTGHDTASGKSWEAWVSKKASQRQAEADRVEAEARARGHL